MTFLLQLSQLYNYSQLRYHEFFHKPAGQDVNTCFPRTFGSPTDQRKIDQAGQQCGWTLPLPCSGQSSPSRTHCGEFSCSRHTSAHLCHFSIWPCPQYTGTASSSVSCHWFLTRRWRALQQLLTPASKACTYTEMLLGRRSPRVQLPWTEQAVPHAAYNT